MGPDSATIGQITIAGVFPTEGEGRALGKINHADALTNAVKKAYHPCYPPRATFTIVNAGDFVDPDLNYPRVDGLTEFLIASGLLSDQFKVLTKDGEVESVQVSYDKFTPDDDKDAPQRKVTSTPLKGTKVKAGDKIKVTITASERYEDGHRSWPTGVQTLQILADNGLVDSKQYGRPPKPCERETFEATYTVPKNPPTIVHLRAMAEDGVGNKDSEVLKFPTVDWKGTWQLLFQKDFINRNEYAHNKDTVQAEFALSVEPNGTVSGAADAVVTLKWDTGSYGHRESGELPATSVRLAVTGRLNGKMLHLKLVPDAGQNPTASVDGLTTTNFFCDLGSLCASGSGQFIEVDLPFEDGASKKIERPEYGGGLQGVVQLQRTTLTAKVG